MTTTEFVGEKREDILRIAARHGACHVRGFGSVARGEAAETGDVDLLEDTPEPTGPWFPVGLAIGLEELLGRRVDVATEDRLYRLIKKRTLKEARPP